MPVNIAVLDKIIRTLTENAGMESEIMLDDSSRDVVCFKSKYDGGFPALENIRHLVLQVVVKCSQLIEEVDIDDLEGPDPEDIMFLIAKKVRQEFGVE